MANLEANRLPVTMRPVPFLSVVGIMGCALFGASSDRLAWAKLTVSPSGHYVLYDGEVLLLVGDSGTQCVLQNLNLDYRRWIDDCAERGIRAVHVWSFIAPRQKQDGSVVEPRYGYVYPAATPWPRREDGPPAIDGLRQWDLTRFDEGDDPTKHYWPRLRDLCGYAKSKRMVLGITVFFGWPKHNRPERPDWSYHPFNVLNGGFLTDDKPITTVCQEIDSPGKEVVQEAWSAAWPPAKKTQWVWERLSQKLIDETQPFGNVFFVFMDEHSYPEGNCADHFLQFFKKRSAVWVDWEGRRPAVDFVMSGTFEAEDKNADAIRGFSGTPARPYFHLEGGPYKGDGARTAMWTFLVGGGHYFFHDDAEQETVTTGIQGYDPKVRGGDKGMVRRDWLGHASRFFNGALHHLDAMAPHNELVKSGHGYCLAAPGVEYAVYSMNGTDFPLDVSQLYGKPIVSRFYDPRSGAWGPERRSVADERLMVFRKPDDRDWTLLVRGG